MAASISFYAGEGFSIANLAGSGLGFYGSGGFGASVNVGSYQDNTFITNSAGTAQGPKVDNVKYVHPSSGELAGADVRSLLGIPNYLATLNIRLTNDTSVKTQNGLVYIFDRTSTSNAASGVTTKVAELIHPWTTASPNGSGDSTWITPAGSSVTVSLLSSPGPSGWNETGPNTSATQHDWYLAISASPDSIGGKTLYGLQASVEYY